jgi:hypothetical protein
VSQSLMDQLSQITDEDGNIVQDTVRLGQWIDARERELGVVLDVVESDTYHPYGCGVLRGPENTTVDYWCLYGSDSGTS